MSQPLIGRLPGFGDRDAVTVDGHTCTYVELADQVTRWERELHRCGVGPGTIVALDSRHLPSACAGVLALMNQGAIIVPLGPIPGTKRDEFLDIAQVELIVEPDHEGSFTAVRTGRRAEHKLYQRLRHGGESGLVLFSSGTTGRSKASVLSVPKLLTRYAQPSRPRRTFSFLGLDHIGGINTLLHTLSHGGGVVAAAQRSPDAVFEAIARHYVQVLPTTPTFLNMVLMSDALEQHSTASLELITYGTEPMPEQTLRRLTTVLPHVRLKQTYGLSELGILPTRSRGDGSLWIALGDNGFAHKVVDGVLWIRSDMAMLGYLNAPYSFDEGGYFNTQDMVEVDGDYIRVLGRRSEVINVGGEKVYPAEVENVLLEMPNIAAATVRGHPSRITGMVVAATVWLVAPEDPKTLARRVREYCADRLEPHKVPAVVELSQEPDHSERFKKIRQPS